MVKYHPDKWEDKSEIEKKNAEEKPKYKIKKNR